ncbi:MAG: hypothetical protein IJ799_02750 [Bacteroidales bacterium]|nr:hypothetical protein [Bacteroidales bacterium]
MNVNLDMLQTMAAGILALVTGLWLNRRIPFLRRICIPAPVTGGIIFSLLTLLLYNLGMEVSFDGTLKDVSMVVFFTTVGFQCDFSAIKKGGRPLVAMTVLVAVLIVLQNVVAILTAKAIGQSPILGMAAGSIPMCGGHGTAAGFSALLESEGLKVAASITMATATFGLVAGSLLGGPLAESIIRRKGLEKEDGGYKQAELLKEIDNDRDERQNLHGYAKATYEIFIAAGIGTLLNKLLAMTGISFPTYFGALLAAVAYRNITEAIPHCPKTAIGEIGSIGSISLSLFLGMAMVSLHLWELSGLAAPLLLMLLAEVVLMFLFSRFVAFPVLGRNYDAAVLISGLCGFGLGATPNAMANMSAVCTQNR